MLTCPSCTKQISQELDKLMREMPEDIRYRWCDGIACSCIGAANCYGGLAKKGFTKKQWEEWVGSNI